MPLSTRAMTTNSFFLKALSEQATCLLRGSFLQDLSIRTVEPLDQWPVSFSANHLLRAGVGGTSWAPATGSPRAARAIAVMVRIMGLRTGLSPAR